jgi:hypothetical protein
MNQVDTNVERGNAGNLCGLFEVYQQSLGFVKYMRIRNLGLVEKNKTKKIE